MNALATYIFYGIVGGPAVALSYGLKEFTPLFCFLALSFTYIASVFVVHLVLSRIGLQYRFRNKVFSMISARVSERSKELALKMEDVAGKFRREFGDLGFYMALTSFTFVFGVYWAGLVAFILRVDLWRSVFSIGLGAVLSVGFWVYVMLKHSVSPEAVTAFFLLLTMAFMAYGLVKENKTISRITEMIALDIGKTFR